MVGLDQWHDVQKRAGRLLPAREEGAEPAMQIMRVKEFGVGCAPQEYSISG
jgi:hypothetical protein